MGLSSNPNYDFVLARYNPADGSLDSSFGAGGRVMTDFSGGLDEIYALRIQPDGKILASGTATNGGGNRDIALARYNSDGSLDSGFGTGGKVTTDFSGGLDGAFAVAVVSAGRILVAGDATNGWTGRDVALARYLADGTPDSDFGAGGKVTADTIGSTHNEVRALAVQANGKIVAAGATPKSTGDFAIARFNANGSPDGSFGSGGVVMTDFKGSPDTANAVLVQPDDKIVAAGGSLDDTVGRFVFALARYLPDGSGDSSFGSLGMVLTSLQGWDDEISAIALQADDRIVAAGLSVDPATNVVSFGLARYNTDGSLDATFGLGGILTTSFFGIDDEAFSAAIQADQKIVVAGYATDAATGAPKFALARYQTDGTPDPSFGSGGLVTTSIFGNDDQARAVAIQADQKIVVAGHATDSVPEFAVARYNVDGSLDSSFGSGGLVTMSLFGNDDEAFAVAIARDQKIVVTGYALSGAREFAIARFNPDGTPDATFGTGGSATTSIDGLGDQASAMAIQADGRLVAGGFTTQSATGRDFALIRYFVCDFLDVPPSNIYHASICSSPWPSRCGEA